MKITALLLFFLIFQLQANDIKKLTPSQINKTIINSIISKTLNKNKTIMFKISEKVNCFEKKTKTICELNNILIKNFKEKKSFYKISIKSALIEISDTLIDNTNYEKQWLYYIKNTQEQKQKKKEIVINNFRIQENFKRILNNTDLIILKDVEIKLMETKIPQIKLASQIKIDFDRNKIEIKNLTTKFFFYYVEKKEKELYNTFKLTTKLKGIKKALALNKIEKPKRDLETIINEIPKINLIFLNKKNKRTIKLSNKQLSIIAKINKNNKLFLKTIKIEDFLENRLKNALNSKEGIFEWIKKYMILLNNDLLSIKQERLK